MKNRILYGTLVLGLLLGLGTYLHRPSKPPVEPETPEQPDGPMVVRPSQTNPTPRASAPTSGYRWQPGDRAAWKTAVQFRIGGAEVTDAAQETVVEGILRLEVAEVTGERVTLVGGFSSANYRTAGATVPQMNALLEATPVRLTMDVEGKLLGLAFSPSLPEADRRALRLVYGWEFVARPGRQYVDRDYTEEDRRLLSTYTRGADGLIIKERSVDAARVAPEGMQQTVIESRFAARPGHLWVARFWGAEESLFIVNSEPFMRGRISLSLEEVEWRQPAGNSGLPAWETFTDRADAATEWPSVVESLKAESVRDRWISVPLEEITSTFKPGVGMEQLVGPLENLREWLGVHGQAGLTQMVSVLADPGLTAEVAATLTHGLTTAPSSVSLAAFETLLGNPGSFPDAVIQQAIVSAGRLGSEAPESVRERLWSLLESEPRLRQNVLLAIASVCRANEPDRRRLADQLRAGLDRGSAPADQAFSLIAASQAELLDPGLIRNARELLGSKDPDVRVASIAFLYRADGNPADLRQQFERDADRRVRAIFNPDDPE